MSAAQRESTHGPLWTAERGRLRVQLWAPRHGRAHWALAWTTVDGDGEVVDGGYVVAGEPSEFPNLVTNGVPLDAVLAAAGAWDPHEECDHSRARSVTLLDDGRHVCGYCGRAFQPSTA